MIPYIALNQSIVFPTVQQNAISDHALTILENISKLIMQCNYLLIRDEQLSAVLLYEQILLPVAKTLVFHVGIFRRSLALFELASSHRPACC